MSVRKLNGGREPIRVQEFASEPRVVEGMGELKLWSVFPEGLEHAAVFVVTQKAYSAWMLASGPQYFGIDPSKLRTQQATIVPASSPLVYVNDQR